MTDNDTTATSTALAIPGDGGLSFEEVLRQRTRSRRQREDATVVDTRMQLHRLEAALAGESKRRVVAIASLRTELQSELQAVEERLMSKLQDDATATNERLVAMEARLSALEQQWQTGLHRVETELENKSTSIGQAVAQLQAQAEQERQARLDRESQLLQRLEELQTYYEGQWQTERQDRLVQTSSINDRLDQLESEQNERVGHVTQHLQQDLALLEQAVQQEVVDRKQEDEAIVGALNRYTVQLQKSLSYIVSSD